MAHFSLFFISFVVATALSAQPKPKKNRLEFSKCEDTLFLDEIAEMIYCRTSPSLLACGGGSKISKGSRQSKVLTPELAANARARRGLNLLQKRYAQLIESESDQLIESVAIEDHLNQQRKEELKTPQEADAFELQLQAFADRMNGNAKERAVSELALFKKIRAEAPKVLRKVKFHADTRVDRINTEYLLLPKDYRSGIEEPIRKSLLKQIARLKKGIGLELIPPEKINSQNVDESTNLETIQLTLNVIDLASEKLLNWLDQESDSEVIDWLKSRSLGPDSLTFLMTSDDLREQELEKSPRTCADYVRFHEKLAQRPVIVRTSCSEKKSLLKIRVNKGEEYDVRGLWLNGKLSSVGFDFKTAAGDCQATIHLDQAGEPQDISMVLAGAKLKLPWKSLRTSDEVERSIKKRADEVKYLVPTIISTSECCAGGKCI